MSLIASIREQLRKRRHRRDARSQRVLERIGQVERLLNEQILQATVRDALARNPLLSHGRKVYSQNDEDGLIEEILRRCGLDHAGSFIELGVGDGTENNTLNLVLKGWRGLWLGGEPVRVHHDGKRLRFRECWIDRDNVMDLVNEELAALGVEQPDVMSVDLDGNDYHVNEALLQGGFRPALWVVEYNARFSPATRWVMPYDANHRWASTDYYGASLAAFTDLFARAGYRLVCCNANGVNAFFVSQTHAERFADDCQRLRGLVHAGQRSRVPVRRTPAGPACHRRRAARGALNRDDVDAYAQWKGWDESAFGRFNDNDARYFQWHIHRALDGQAPRRVLEIGFGNGSFLGFGRDRGWEMTGVEASLELRARAERAGFRVATDIDALANEPSFDLVVLVRRTRARRGRPIDRLHAQPAGLVEPARSHLAAGAEWRFAIRQAPSARRLDSPRHDRRTQAASDRGGDRSASGCDG